MKSVPVENRPRERMSKRGVESLSDAELLAVILENGSKSCIVEHIAQELLKENTFGSLDDIAAITDRTGRVIGMMPHLERAISFTHLPHWTYLKEAMIRSGEEIPQAGLGLQLFENGVEYFR